MGEKIELKDIFIVVLSALLGAGLSRYITISDNFIFNTIWLFVLAWLLVAFVWVFSYFFNKFQWGTYPRKKRK